MTVAPNLYPLICVREISIQDLCIEGLSRSLTAQDITFRSVWTEIVHHGILLDTWKPEVSVPVYRRILKFGEKIYHETTFVVVWSVF